MQKQIYNNFTVFIYRGKVVLKFANFTAAQICANVWSLKLRLFFKILQILVQFWNEPERQNDTTIPKFEMLSLSIYIYIYI